MSDPPNAHGPQPAAPLDGAVPGSTAGAVPAHSTGAGSVGAASVGAALESCRNYLLHVANQQLGEHLSARAGASDVVQETFLEAQRVFDRFEGGSTDHLRLWLRAILLNKVATLRRFHGADKREPGREVRLDPAGGSGAPAALQPGRTATPSTIVSGREEQSAVREALARLPEHYRRVLVWRQWDDLPFEEIGRRLNKSTDAARMLWWRAAESLGQELAGAVPRRARPTTPP